MARICGPNTVGAASVVVGGGRGGLGFYINKRNERVRSKVFFDFDKKRQNKTTHEYCPSVYVHQ